MKSFTEKESRFLYRSAKQAKEEGKSLTSVFLKVADKTGMAYGSVRNYYYRNIESNPSYGVSAKKIVQFNDGEDRELVKKILAERVKTRSVRSAINNIAGGDSVLAVRYQNKFRNMLKKNRELIESEVEKQKQSGEKYFDPYEGKSGADQEVLLREIDNLVKKISKKCAKENAVLKAKLSEYEKLKTQTEQTGIVENYFSTDKRKCH